MFGILAHAWWFQCSSIWLRLICFALFAFFFKVMAPAMKPMKKAMKKVIKKKEKKAPAAAEAMPEEVKTTPATLKAPATHKKEVIKKNEKDFKPDSSVFLKERGILKYKIQSGRIEDAR